MGEFTTCARCGASVPTWARFCQTCAQPMLQPAPAPPAAMPPAALPPVPPVPPVPAAYVPAAGQPWSGAPMPPFVPTNPFFPSPKPSRPCSVIVLTVGMVIAGLIGLLVAREYFYWGAWRADYGTGDTNAVVDMALGVTYLVTSGLGFALAEGLWSMRVPAWLGSLALNIFLMGVAVFEGLWWGIEVLTIVGIVAHVAMLGLLILPSVRRVFNRRLALS